MTLADIVLLGDFAIVAQMFQATQMLEAGKSWLSQSQKNLTRIPRKSEWREFFIEFCENSPNWRFSR
jgi:hypothetical protein